MSHTISRNQLTPGNPYTITLANEYISGKGSKNLTLYINIIDHPPGNFKLFYVIDLSNSENEIYFDLDDAIEAYNEIIL